MKLKNKLPILLLILILFTGLLSGCTFIFGNKEDGEIVLKVESIAIDSYPKNVYFLNDKFETLESYIIVSYENQKIQRFPLTIDMVAKFDSSKLGKQDVIITYQGASTIIPITVEPLEIDFISVDYRPEVISILQGKSLDLSVIDLQINYRGGKKAPITIIPSMIRDFNNNKVGMQTITLDYSGHTTTLDVVVKARSITKISVDKKPDKTNYFVGNDLEPKGLIVKIFYDNDTSELVKVDNNTQLPSDLEILPKTFTEKNLYSKVSVTYKGIHKTTFDVNVTDKKWESMILLKEPLTAGLFVDGVQTTPNTMLNIIQGEEIDKKTGSVEVTFDDGTKEEITLNNPRISISGYDKDNAVKQSVKITYEGHSEHYIYMDVEVHLKKAIKVELFKELFDIKSNYIVGQKIDISLIEYQVYYNNGTKSEKAFITLDDVNNDSSTTVKESPSQTINFTIEGVVVSITIQSTLKIITDIRLDAPISDIVKVGSNNLDLTGGFVHCYYNDNSFEKINLEQNMISCDNTNYLNNVGEYTIKVTYKTKVMNFQITVAEVVATSLAIKNKPYIPTQYFESQIDLINWQDIVLLVELSDGTEKEISVDKDSMLYVFDRELRGVQEVIIRYLGKTVAYSIDIVPRKELSIELEKAPQTLYCITKDSEGNVIAPSLNLDNIIIKKYFNDNTTSSETDIKGSNWKVIAPALNSVGEKIITIKYTNKYDEILSTSFVVYVKDLPVYSISVDARTFTVAVGDSLNTIGAFLTVNYGIDSTISTGQIPLLHSMTNYEKNNNTLGIRQVNVYWGGKETTITVDVKNIELKNISINQLPTKMKYTVGQKLVLTGGIINRSYGLPGSETITFTDTMSMTDGSVQIKSFVSDPIGNNDISFVLHSATIQHKGKEVSFEVTTYKKLFAKLNYNNLAKFYGSNNTIPTVNVIKEIEGFELPGTTMEFLVNGVYTAVVPFINGDYPIRVTVHENEYYNGSQVANQIFNISTKYITITVDNSNKIYGDADPILTYFIADNDLVTNSGVKDVLGLKVVRTRGENVIFNTNGNIDGYAIDLEVDNSQPNQNSRYNIKIIKGIFKIYEKQLTANITFEGTSNLIEDGTRKSIIAHYNNGGKKVYIDQKDILIYKEDILQSGGAIYAGVYTVKISPNYIITGTSSQTFTILPQLSNKR